MLDIKICNKISAYTIWDAVVAWRDYILSSNLERTTKVLNLSRMVYLIRNGYFILQNAIDSVDEIWVDRIHVGIALDITRSRKTVAADKACVNSFYKFIIERKSAFKDKSRSNIPNLCQVPHIVTSMEERIKAYVLNDSKWSELFASLLKTNPRDYLICYLIWMSGKNVLEILNLRKESLNIVKCMRNNRGEEFSSSVRLNDNIIPIPDNIARYLHELSKENHQYLFESTYKKKICPNQIVRALKTASRFIGIDFDITTRIFQSCAIVLRESRKKHILEKIQK